MTEDHDIGLPGEPDIGDGASASDVEAVFSGPLTPATIRALAARQLDAIDRSR